MLTIHFITRRADGTTDRRDVPATPGQSLMQAATQAGVEAIAADCGGTLTCATCHVLLPAESLGRVPPAGDDELAMLEFTAAPRQAGSRLSCQIVLTAEDDGLAIELPDRQY